MFKKTMCLSLALALLMTLMIPVQVIIIPEYYLMMKLGWINTFLLAMQINMESLLDCQDLL